MTTKQDVLNALETITDPEIAMDIVNLGLVYDIAMDEKEKRVHVKMTLTTPACPMLDQLLEEIETKLKALPDVEQVKIEIVWEPPWSPDMMSDQAKIALGIV